MKERNQTLDTRHQFRAKSHVSPFNMLTAHELAICKIATAVSFRFYIDRQIFKIP